MLRRYGLDGHGAFTAPVQELQRVVAASGHYPLIALDECTEGPTPAAQMAAGFDFLLDGIGTKIPAS